MPTKWYYRVKKRVFGPFTSKELLREAKASRLLPCHEVRKDDDPWIAASRVKDLFGYDFPGTTEQSDDSDAEKRQAMPILKQNQDDDVDVVSGQTSVADGDAWRLDTVWSSEIAEETHGIDSHISVKPADPIDVDDGLLSHPNESRRRAGPHPARKAGVIAGTYWGILALILLAVIATNQFIMLLRVAFPKPAPSPEPFETVRWEYGITSPPDDILDIKMDQFGNQGWELVTARRAADSSNKMSYEMIFKRQLPP